jgi:hypothetical protein
MAGRTEQLEDLLPDLVELTVTPYLGAEEAIRIAKSPPPGSAGLASSTGG